MKALNTALTNIRRTPYQAMVAVLMITITFFVAYTFSLTMLGAKAIVQFFETRPEVIAFFHLSTETQEIKEIAAEMEAKDYTETVTIVTKEEALNIYQEDYKSNPLLLELVTADILPASIEVSATELEYLTKVEKDLEAYSEIEDVVLQQDIIKALNNWASFLRMTGIVSVIILAVTSFLLLIIILGLKISNKKNSIAVMSIIGASKSFIFAPFLLEVVIYSVLSSLFGWGLMLLGFLYASPLLRGFLSSIISWPIHWSIFVYQLVIGTAAGILLSAFASLIAVARLIKK
ncbi:MAG: permease-like cell division protein FtsX [Candidatus Woesebacteria bacterium]|jgi:cell division transport system permease protein